MNCSGTWGHWCNAKVQEPSLCSTSRETQPCCKPGGILHNPPANLGCIHSSWEPLPLPAWQSSGYVGNLFPQDPDERSVSICQNGHATGLQRPKWSTKYGLEAAKEFWSSQGAVKFTYSQLCTVWLLCPIKFDLVSCLWYQWLYFVHWNRS